MCLFGLARNGRSAIRPVAHVNKKGTSVLLTKFGVGSLEMCLLLNKLLGSSKNFCSKQEGGERGERKEQFQSRQYPREYFIHLERAIPIWNYNEVGAIGIYTISGTAYIVTSVFEWGYFILHTYINIH